MYRAKQAGGQRYRLHDETQAGRTAPI